MRITAWQLALVMAALWTVQTAILGWVLYRLAVALRALREAVLKDNITGLSAIAGTLRDGYRALDAARIKIEGVSGEIAAVATTTIEAPRP